MEGSLELGFYSQRQLYWHNNRHQTALKEKPLLKCPGAVSGPPHTQLSKATGAQSGAGDDSELNSELTI